MRTFTATIFDGGVSVERSIEASNIEGACSLIEQEMRAAEEVTAGDPGCDPRTDWTCIITGDDYAECSLKTPGEQNAAAWLKVKIDPGQRSGDKTMTTLKLWVANMSDFGADADYTADYLAAANAPEIMRSHPTVTLSDTALTAESPNDLWAAYSDLRAAVKASGHGTDDAEAEEANPPRLTAILTKETGGAKQLQVVVAPECATWQDYCREARITPEKIAAAVLSDEE